MLDLFGLVVMHIVPVENQDSGKIRVCIDFRDLNKATPKDEYPMHIANMLINEASGHRVISFLDGNMGYIYGRRRYV